MATVMVASTSASAFSLFLPNAFSVDYFDPDNDDIRRGEIMAAVWSFGIALLVTRLTGDYVPLLVWGIVTAGMAFVYETRTQIWDQRR